MQATRPPASQLLYDLGVKPDGSLYSDTGKIATSTDSDFRLPGTIEQVQVAWPPMVSPSMIKEQWRVPDKCTILPLPLRHMDTASTSQNSITAKAALAKSSPGQPRRPHVPRVINVMSEYNVGRHDMATIYMSPDPYFDAFEQPLNLRHFDYAMHPTAGMSLYVNTGRLYLAAMSPSTPAEKIHDWCTRVRGAWLIKIGNTTVTSIVEAGAAFEALRESNAMSTVLFFAHSEI